ncbi:SRPBCC domain-containing protein [Aestuariibius sp. HNIBRBA575]|uniref:SRPBCC domain-containing protein n=1 Tax=Aestuariibius sp. HNIBRBA575 TaxID=3233343 RepID=UPI0034A332A4
MTNPCATAKVFIRRPVSAVYDAFADPEIMTKFWFPKARGQLETGKDVLWYLGTDTDAYAITVRVKSAIAPREIIIDWGDEDQFTQVVWTFEGVDDGTVMTITESGFAGPGAEINAAALASTGGFNQVAIAAKALLEHRAAINIVQDHVA